MDKLNIEMLKDHEPISYYLTPDDVRNILISEWKTHFGSQEALAKEIGISGGFINDIIHGHRFPSKRVLEYFGVHKIVIYIR